MQQIKGKCWYITNDNIDGKLKQEFGIIYKTPNKKLDNVIKQQGNLC